MCNRWCCGIVAAVKHLFGSCKQARSAMRNGIKDQCKTAQDWGAWMEEQSRTYGAHRDIKHLPVAKALAEARDIIVKTKAMHARVADITVPLQMSVERQEVLNVVTDLVQSGAPS